MGGSSRLRIVVTLYENAKLGLLLTETSLNIILRNSELQSTISMTIASHGRCHPKTTLLAEINAMP